MKSTTRQIILELAKRTNTDPKDIAKVLKESVAREIRREVTKEANEIISRLLDSNYNPKEVAYYINLLSKQLQDQIPRF